MNMSEMRMPLGFNILSWVLRVTAAVILLQTLFFKFTAAPESVYIFTKVHAEPWGRIGSGVMELVAAILLLIPPIIYSIRARSFETRRWADSDHPMRD